VGWNPTNEQWEQILVVIETDDEEDETVLESAISVVDDETGETVLGLDPNSKTCRMQRLRIRLESTRTQ